MVVNRVTEGFSAGWESMQKGAGKAKAGLVKFGKGVSSKAKAGREKMAEKFQEIPKKFKKEKGEGKKGIKASKRDSVVTGEPTTETKTGKVPPKIFPKPKPEQRSEAREFTRAELKLQLEAKIGAKPAAAGFKRTERREEEAVVPTGEAGERLAAIAKDIAAARGNLQGEEITEPQKQAELPTEPPIGKTGEEPAIAKDSKVVKEHRSRFMKFLDKIGKSISDKLTKVTKNMGEYLVKQYGNDFKRTNEKIDVGLVDIIGRASFEDLKSLEKSVNKVIDRGAKALFKMHMEGLKFLKKPEDRAALIKNAINNYRESIASIVNKLKVINPSRKGEIAFYRARMEVERRVLEMLQRYENKVEGSKKASVEEKTGKGKVAEESKAPTAAVAAEPIEEESQAA